MSKSYRCYLPFVGTASSSIPVRYRIGLDSRSMFTSTVSINSNSEDGTKSATTNVRCRCGLCDYIRLSALLTAVRAAATQLLNCCCIVYNSFLLCFLVWRCTTGSRWRGVCMLCTVRVVGWHHRDDMALKKTLLKHHKSYEFDVQ